MSRPLVEAQRNGFAAAFRTDALQNAILSGLGKRGGKAASEPATPPKAAAKRAVKRVAKRTPTRTASAKPSAPGKKKPAAAKPRLKKRPA